MSLLHINFQKVQNSISYWFQYFGDNRFMRAIIKYAELQSLHSEVYFYQFSYHGAMGDNKLSVAGKLFDQRRIGFIIFRSDFVITPLLADVKVFVGVFSSHWQILEKYILSNHSVSNWVWWVKYQILINIMVFSFITSSPFSIEWDIWKKLIIKSLCELWFCERSLLFITFFPTSTLYVSISLYLQKGRVQFIYII